jgi:hypothetical protein
MDNFTSAVSHEHGISGKGSVSHPSITVKDKNNNNNNSNDSDNNNNEIHRERENK